MKPPGLEPKDTIYEERINLNSALNIKTIKDLIDMPSKRRSSQIEQKSEAKKC